jgi:hypothetical protein
LVRRLLAIAVAAATATSSIAYGATVNCPRLRARVASHCCCPPMPPGEQAQLSCCTADGHASAITAPARKQTERVPLAAVMSLARFWYRSDDVLAPLRAAALALPPSTAGPPPVRLRI